MKAIDCFKSIPDDGVCPIDRDKMEKGFNLCCRLVKHPSNSLREKNEWLFIEYSLHAKNRWRVTISEDDANWLISTFWLTEVPAKLGNSIIYLPQVI